MSQIEFIVQHWCREFMLEPDWPEGSSVEEILNDYLFPQIKQVLTDMEQDRESYQTRFYTMQWAFRRFLKEYGQIVKNLEQSNIHLFTEDIMQALVEERH